MGSIRLVEFAARWKAFPRRRPLSERYESQAESLIDRFVEFVTAGNPAIHEMAQVQSAMAHVAPPLTNQRNRRTQSEAEPMSTTVLNEHDANQGAQSKGEFLGMTGNCGWWLLGSAGASVMMVIVLWGVLGVSLLLCVLLGVVLCVLSVVYVFALKNNKPNHYDTDFFEAALVEAGVFELAFGPRMRRPLNPFAVGAAGGGATR